MTSEINNQFVYVERLIPPQGVNVATNSSPSLTPTSGALAWDKSVNSSTYNNLYLGTGTNWVAIPSSLTRLTSTFSMTSSGQPSFTGCTLSLETVTVGSIMMKLVSLNINQTITASGSGVWSSPAATVPATFSPTAPVAVSYTVFLPCYISIGGTPNITYFSIDSSGAVNLFIPTSGTILVTCLPGNYI